MRLLITDETNEDDFATPTDDIGDRNGIYDLLQAIGIKAEGV